MISLQDLTQHVRTILESQSGARIIAFRAPEESSIPREGTSESIGAQRYEVVHANSELAIRAAIVGFERAKTSDVLVLVTPLQASELSLDVTHRIVKGKVFEFDPWEAIRTIFGARDIDPRLRQYRGLGRALLRSSGTTNYAPIVTTQLTEEVAWQRFLRQEYGLGQDLGDVKTWLEWALRQPESLRRMGEDDELVDDVSQMVERRLGSAGKFILERLMYDRQETYPARQLLLSSLAMRAIEAASKEPEHAALATQARGALPSHFGWKSSQSLIAELSSVASVVTRIYGKMEREEPALVSWVSDALDGVFRDLEIEELSLYSRTSELGWKALLTQFARALDAHDVELVADVMERMQRHDEFTTHDTFSSRLKHLQRLNFYINEDLKSTHRDVARMARDYIAHGSFEDWLRMDLTSADLGSTLHASASSLLERLHERREVVNARFARKAVEHLSGNQASLPGTLPIQHVLSDVVAPIARDHAVLMVVLDGLSWGVMRSLLNDPTLEKSWTPWVPHQSGAIWPMCAALPTVTALSRHALLTGRVEKGNQKTEKQGFKAHAKLCTTTKKKAGLAPVLFHKAELDSSGVGGVGVEVRDAILDQNQQVVGVVVNAIDDQLGGAEQVNLQWSVDTISPLRTLLGLADTSQRVVILVGDHGHIWEDNSRVPDGVQGTHGRWRVEGGDVSKGEVALRGILARTFMGVDEVILPYSERIRYSHAHRGYHGGVTLQEVVTPLVILSRQDELVVSEDELELAQLVTTPPAWWSLSKEEAPVAWPDVVAARTRETAPPAQQPAPAPQLDLLSLTITPTVQEKAPDVPIERPLPATTAKQVERILNSSIYISQASRNKAIFSSQESVFRILVTLLEKEGHRTTDRELARIIQKAGSRTRRLITAMVTVLNVEGYEVLHYERGDGTVKLDEAMLRTQFEMGDD